MTERGTDYQRQLATLVNRIQSMLDVNDRDVDTLVGNDEWRQAVEQYLRNGTLAELQAEAERILRPPYVDAPVRACLPLQLHCPLAATERELSELQVASRDGDRHEPTAHERTSDGTMQWMALDQKSIRYV